MGNFEIKILVEILGIVAKNWIFGILLDVYTIEM